MTGEELRKIVDNSGFSKSEIADRLGIVPQALNQALNAADVKSGFLERISKVLGLSLAQLYGSKESIGSLNKSIETRPRIPMQAVAGSLNGFTNSVVLDDCEQIPVIKALPNYDFTMIVKGDSMEPKFEGGDEIAIRKVYSLIEWGKTYVLDTRDGVVLKRLYDAGDNYRCVSFNKDYPDFTVNKSDVFGIYKVVGLIRI